MRLNVTTIVFSSLLLLSACNMTQSPVNVSDSAYQAAAPVVPTAVETAGSPVSVPIVAAERPSIKPALESAAPREGLALDALPRIARELRKDPSAARKYTGQRLSGKGKFVKTAKGNPNAVVADVRVSGLGEVSLWCRSVTEGANRLAAGRVVVFEGLLTGSVYTSEDFSHDVTLKDCRFHD